MTEEQRKLFLAETKEEREKLSKEKEELELLKQNEVVKKYIALKEIIDAKKQALPQEFLRTLNGVMQDNCNHDIYLFVGYAFREEGKWVDSSYLLGSYKHYVCLDCMQDVYIRRRGTIEFEEKNMVIYLPGDYFDIMERDIINLRKEYINYMLQGDTTSDAYKKIRKKSI